MALSAAHERCGLGKVCGGPFARVAALYATGRAHCEVPAGTGSSFRCDVPKGLVVSLTAGASLRYFGWR